MGGNPGAVAGGGGTLGAAAGSSAAAGAGGAAAGSAGSAGMTASTHVGFYVDGRTLRDHCGEKVVLRGINEMVIYTPSQDGTPYFAEMAKTGANAVRITWNTTGSAAKLDAAMSNAIASQMIPMVVLNDATGDLTKVGLEVDYWTRNDVTTVVKKYQDKALVNIANEAGNGQVTQDAFTSTYQSAITRLRTAGIHTPLVIDGSSWGQDIDMLQATGPGLLSFDPDHNLVFSVHTYWNDASGARIMSEISQSVTMNLPLIVGEFAQHAVAGCSSSPFAYKVLLSEAKTNEIGYLPWSWGAAKNSDCQDDQPFDMTSGTYATLQGWGKEVSVTDPNSIMNTSVRSRYMTTGSCK
jgi:mannan endo-1,4-beta-mannosidase